MLGHIQTTNGYLEDWWWLKMICLWTCTILNSPKSLTFWSVYQPHGWFSVRSSCSDLICVFLNSLELVTSLGVCVWVRQGHWYPRLTSNSLYSQTSLWISNPPVPIPNVVYALTVGCCGWNRSTLQHRQGLRQLNYSLSTRMRIWKQSCWEETSKRGKNHLLRLRHCTST